ncbi:FCD domain-containing protein [Herbiconiux sp.]|uniref:FadR/GntR family transcriptional regulator n=1 Tax=Herbiconiux sp. TaxID=1871186 RepID=UPI0025BAAF47|nr:FCD domain-containing protein [Herbiconiux sp.]
MSSEPHDLSPHPVLEGSGAGTSTAIADRIASSISIGLLSVGERLPTEIELAQQFGVAVATLRKALAVLRERELVVTRRGRSGGTFVVSAPFPVADDVERRIAGTSLVELRDLRDEYVAIGTAVAALAARRAWGESLRRLRDLAEQVVVPTEPSEIASADSRFHIELAVLSQSARLLRTELRLQSEIGPLLWSVVEGTAAASVVHDQHLAIIEALEAGDGERAVAAVRAHLEHDILEIMDAKLSNDGATAPSSSSTSSTAGAS